MHLFQHLVDVDLVGLNLRGRVRKSAGAFKRPTPRQRGVHSRGSRNGRGVRRGGAARARAAFASRAFAFFLVFFFSAAGLVVFAAGFLSAFFGAMASAVECEG